MIDSHCHLVDAQFAADLPAVLERAKTAGVSRMITIADNLEESEKCVSLAKKYDHIFCTVGVHPHAASTWDDTSAPTLRAMTSFEKVVAIGEAGLDYHYMNSPKEDQLRAFEVQILLAKELNLPIVVHCREAINDVSRLLLKHRPRAVIHCCTEKWKNVAPLVDAGMWLSFTGMATYPKMTWIRETIAVCPLDCMMIETDSPYLAPQEKRGKRNEPANVVAIAECIAEQKQLPVSEIIEKTTANTLAFFKLSS